MARRFIHFLSIIVALFLIALSAGAQENTFYNNIIRLSYTPLGGYNYSVIHGTDFYGGFNEVSLGYESRFFGWFGMEVYFDFRGHKYEGYEGSSNSLVRIWGTPGLRFGVGSVIHPFQSSVWDLTISSGLDYVEYIHSMDDFFPGLGATVRVEVFWLPIPYVGIGVQIRGHYSRHNGGPYPSDPGRSRNPFDIFEAGGGLVGRVDF